MKRPYSSPLHTRRLPALSVSQGETQSGGKDRKDEIETFPHWLRDYKSTNQTDEGQMRAELTQHPFHSIWWGRAFKRWTRLGRGSR